MNSRLAFEVFHNIQELVVDFGLAMELDLDLIEIAQCILYYVSHCLWPPRPK